MSLLVFIVSCVNHEIPEPIDCSKINISLLVISHSDVTSCLSKDGSFEVRVSEGKDIFYEYSINRLDYQQTGRFDYLNSGNYIVSARDKNDCTGTINMIVRNLNSDLSAVINTIPDSECFSDNGEAYVDIAGGSPPYSLYLANNEVTEPMLFKNLHDGLYNLRVTDAASCTLFIAFKIPRVSTGISFNSEIRPIIETRCAKSGCHTAGTGRVDFTIFSNVKENAALIKLYTQTFRMPRDGVLSMDQIQKISCWVDDGAIDN